MRTLVGAAEPDDPDPASGFTATSSTVPWLYELRDDTVPLTRTVTTSTASGGHLPLIYRTDRSEP